MPKNLDTKNHSCLQYLTRRLQKLPGCKFILTMLALEPFSHALTGWISICRYWTRKLLKWKRRCKNVIALLRVQIVWFRSSSSRQVAICWECVTWLIYMSQVTNSHLGMCDMTYWYMWLSVQDLYSLTQSMCFSSRHLASWKVQEVEFAVLCDFSVAEVFDSFITCNGWCNCCCTLKPRNSSNQPIWSWKKSNSQYNFSVAERRIFCSRSTHSFITCVWLMQMATTEQSPQTPARNCQSKARRPRRNRTWKPSENERSHCQGLYDEKMTD